MHPFYTLWKQKTLKVFCFQGVERVGIEKKIKVAERKAGGELSLHSHHSHLLT